MNRSAVSRSWRGADGSRHRPSGTENVYKIYAESFRSASHLADIVSEAQSIVYAALAV